MAKAVGEAARSVAEVAAAHKVSCPTTHRAFVAHAAAVLTEPEPSDTGFVDLASDQDLAGPARGDHRRIALAGPSPVRAGRGGQDDVVARAAALNDLHQDTLRLRIHTLVVVDEAAMVGTRDLRELLARPPRPVSRRCWSVTPTS
jgi:hypothetical protein